MQRQARYPGLAVRGRRAGASFHCFPTDFRLLSTDFGLFLADFGLFVELILIFDAQIGRLLDTLDKEGLSKSTMVIFSGDSEYSSSYTSTPHLAPTPQLDPQEPDKVLAPADGPEDPHIYFNSQGDPGPFRGQKRSLYDGGVRMPLIARWVGTIPAGRVSAEEIMSADWLPTVASLAGAALLPYPAAGGPLFGADRAAAFVPTAPPLKARPLPVMWDYRADGYGYCWNQAPELAIQHGNFKLLMNRDKSRYELFNRSLTFEADDISKEQPAEAARLEGILTKWAATLDPIPPVILTRMLLIFFKMKKMLVVPFFA